jgi:hypothetical protein
MRYVFALCSLLCVVAPHAFAGPSTDLGPILGNAKNHCIELVEGELRGRFKVIDVTDGDTLTLSNHRRVRLVARQAQTALGTPGI